MNLHIAMRQSAVKAVLTLKDETGWTAKRVAVEEAAGGKFSLGTVRKFGGKSPPPDLSSLSQILSDQSFFSLVGDDLRFAVSGVASEAA